MEKEENKKRPTVIDLFCGAGGMSLGFELEGFQNIFSVDCNKSFCKTYRKNFPKHNLLERDIKSLTEEEISKLTERVLNKQVLISSEDFFFILYFCFTVGAGKSSFSGAVQ